MNPIDLVIAVIFLVLGAAAGYFFHRYQAESPTQESTGEG